MIDPQCVSLKNQLDVEGIFHVKEREYIGPALLTTCTAHDFRLSGSLNMTCLATGILMQQ